MWVSGGGLEVSPDRCGGHSSHSGGWYTYDLHCGTCTAEMLVSVV